MKARTVPCLEITVGLSFTKCQMTETLALATLSSLADCDLYFLSSVSSFVGSRKVKYCSSFNFHRRKMDRSDVMHVRGVFA